LFLRFRESEKDGLAFGGIDLYSPMVGPFLDAVKLSFWTMLVAFSELLWEHQMAVSSANILVLVLWMSEMGKSLQYTM
jgi:hypothetical protein